jgi:murein DD-endopeptidase MepM/ murein hydrolase activator NlpD
VVIITIGGSIWFIDNLKIKINVLKIDKKHEIEKLIIKKKELVMQNKLYSLEIKDKIRKLVTQKKIYSLEIKDKIKDIETLGSKLDDIEKIIGLKTSTDTTNLSRVIIAKMTSIERMYMLQVIPNGYPLKKVIITDQFGYRKHPILKKRKFHRGLDFRAMIKTPVLATADGIIKYVQNKNTGGFGRVIVVSHNYGFETIYAHLRKSNVKIGDVVKKGEMIALSGNSGRSTGPHLHYEVKYASMTQNPLYFVKWDFEHYETIFNKTRSIKWDYLLAQIRQHKKLQEQQ